MNCEGWANLGAAALVAVPLGDVRIEDPFWSPKREVWRNVTIADCLDKFEKDGALKNFDAVRDGGGGEHGGPPWYDGLVYEMITGCADFMSEQPDPRLERRIDGYIERIAAAAAKDPDGYINTYTELKDPHIAGEPTAATTAGSTTSTTPAPWSRQASITTARPEAQSC